MNRRLAKLAGLSPKEWLLLPQLVAFSLGIHLVLLAAPLERVAERLADPLLIVHGLILHGAGRCSPGRQHIGGSQQARDRKHGRHFGRRRNGERRSAGFFAPDRPLY
mgnify:CR=1 FL=1